LAGNPTALIDLALLDERGCKIDQRAGTSAHERRVNGSHRLLQDRLSGGWPCKLHQALASPPGQMRAVEVRDPAWSLVRLHLSEGCLGAIQGTEAGVDFACDGMGFRLRAT
jgi:hypothetical protein